jgi:hypothetical protein
MVVDPKLYTKCFPQGWHIIKGDIKIQNLIKNTFGFFMGFNHTNRNHNKCNQV